MTARAAATLTATIVLALALAAGCSKPSMGPFDVTPHVTCPRSTVTVAWKATEDVVLYQQSLPAPDGLLCPSPPADAVRTPLPGREGTTPATVERDTRFTLCFVKADPTMTRIVDVKVTDGSPIRMGGIATCAANELRTSLTATPAQAAAALPVAAIANRTTRALVIDHEGVASPVPAGGQTDAFRGKAYAGEWVIRSPLAAGETCDQVLTAVASRLRLELFFDCGGK